MQEVLPDLAALIDKWKPPTAEGRFELEARLGTWKGDYFEAGLSKSMTEQLVMMLHSFDKWHTVTDWEETHDYFYDIPTPPSSKSAYAHELWKQRPTMVRTTTSFIPHRTTLTTSHMRKYPVAKVDLKLQNLVTADLCLGDNFFAPASLARNAPSHLDVRFCLNYEEVVPVDQVGLLTNPQSVRIKARKSFFYQPSSCPASSPVWKFDVTRLWQGKDKSTAEGFQQRGEKTLYELELECIDPGALLNTSPKHDSTYVACSMMLKMQDFVKTFSGSSAFRWVAVQPPLAYQSNNSTSFA